MKRNNFITVVILSVAVLASCSLFETSSNYDDYTWDGTAYTDADSDGIPDVAEAEGTSFYDLPLYDWGARPGVPDLFIHVAPMEAGIDSYGYPDAGMLLQKNALDKVVAAFAAQGISVHFDVGKNRLFNGYSEITNRGISSYNLSGKDHSIPYNNLIYLSGYSSGYVYVDKLKSQYLPINKYQIFYFLVVGSAQSTDPTKLSSGVAWTPGRDFLMTLGKWGLFFGDTTDPNIGYDEMKNLVTNFQASTIMHEFGHNLGLYHGGRPLYPGTTNVSEPNYKPNYISIMNYLYQLDGLPQIGNNEGDRYLRDNDKISSSFNLVNSPYSASYKIDYSYGTTPDLDENNLVESDGFQLSNSVPIDWNLSDTTDLLTISADITQSNGDGEKNILYDFNDWANLRFFYNENHPGVSRTLDNIIGEISDEIPRNLDEFMTLERR